MKEIQDLLKEYDSLLRVYNAKIGDRLRRNRLPEYDEVLFSYHSCAIEGNSFSVDETKTLKEKGLGMIPEGKTFRDGNGRLGRLMTNFILLKKGHPILIVPIEKRAEYITTLKMIRKEATDEYLVRFFLDTAIERMQRDLKEKEEMTSISDTTDFF